MREQDIWQRLRRRSSVIAAACKFLEPTMPQQVLARERRPFLQRSRHLGRAFRRLDRRLGGHACVRPAARLVLPAARPVLPEARSVPSRRTPTGPAPPEARRAPPRRTPTGPVPPEAKRVPPRGIPVGSVLPEARCVPSPRIPIGSQLPALPESNDPLGFVLPTGTGILTLRLGFALRTARCKLPCRVRLTVGGTAGGVVAASGRPIVAASGWPIILNVILGL